jgi:hypothetical protein
VWPSGSRWRPSGGGRRFRVLLPRAGLSCETPTTLAIPAELFDSLSSV